MFAGTVQLTQLLPEQRCPRNPRLLPAKNRPSPASQKNPSQGPAIGLKMRSEYLFLVFSLPRGLGRLFLFVRKVVFHLEPFILVSCSGVPRGMSHPVQWRPLYFRIFPAPVSFLLSPLSFPLTPSSTHQGEVIESCSFADVSPFFFSRTTPQRLTVCETV